MSIVFEYRRKFLGQVTGVGLLGSLAGCTAIGPVGVEIIIENTGTREERTEYHIDREETTTEAQTIDVEAGDERTVSVEVKRGDVVVVSKADLGFECTLDDYVCRNPTLQVDTGFGALGVGGECFNIRPQ